MSIARSAVLPDSSRSSNASPGDPRAARTRQGILDAVARLRVAGVADISVSEIVREAKISRSSFYAHFSSLDDLAGALLRQEFTEVGALSRDGSATTTNIRDSYRRLVDHFSQHESIYSGAAGLPLSRRAFDDVIAAYADQLFASLDIADDPAAGIRGRMAATYIAGGTISLLSSWIAGDHAISAEQLIDELIELLPSSLT